MTLCNDELGRAPPGDPADTSVAIEPDILEVLLLGARAGSPAPDRVDALRARVLERARATVYRADGTLTIFGNAGDWVALAPRVHMKKLHQDTSGHSYLLRLEPGAVLPNHAHDGDEECMVVEGEVFLGELRVRAGDYHLAPAGTRHSGIISPAGALLFVRSAANPRYEVHR